MKTLVLFILLVVANACAFAQNIQLLGLHPECKRATQYEYTFDKSGNLWLGTDKGLLEYDGTKWTIQVPGYVNKIFIDSQNRKWFCNTGKSTIGASNPVTIYSGGLHMLDESNKIITDFSDSVKSNVINDFCEDVEGNIFIATGEKVNNQPKFMTQGGLYKYNGKEIINLYKEKIVTLKFIKKIYKTNDNLWFLEGGSSGEIIQYKNNQFIELSKITDYPTKGVLDIIADDEGNTWFLGGHSKIFNMNKNGEFGALYYIKPFSYGYTKFYNYNEFIYLIEAGRFLAYNKSKKTWDYPKGQPSTRPKKWVWKLAELPDHTVMLGTKQGIKEYKNGVMSEIKYLNGLYITLLYTLNDGTLLIGTKESGLYLYKNNEITKCEKDSHGNILPLAYYSIKTGKDNALYITTSMGILKVQND
jgi:ligand-binding sensor domain-containing protein